MGDPMRSWLSFDVDGAKCAATLDEADHWHGLLIVSGGNEVRSGAHRGMALLAAQVAAAGHPVLRFDRRGIGDSEGENGGFETSWTDIAAAINAFYDQCPSLCTVTAFGNCDAAAALLLQNPQPPGLNFLMLANPWTIDGDATSDLPSMPSASAIRKRYATKLRNPSELVRLLTGHVSMAKVWRGLIAAMRRQRHISDDTTLRSRIAAALHAVDDRNITIVLAEGDRTASEFTELWDSPACAEVRARSWVKLYRHPTASHSFADDDSRAWLTARVLDALRD
jgi:exosortase A-associated hydrolase 1